MTDVLCASLHKCKHNPIKTSFDIFTYGYKIYYIKVCDPHQHG